MLEGAHLLVDGYTAVVAYTFVGVGSDVENAGLAAVGVAYKGHVDGAATFFGDMLCRTLGFDLDSFVVAMVCNLLLGFTLTYYFNSFGIAAAQ